MSKTFKTKRRIEKIRNVINDSITNSISELVLHTAEDAKTLVRTIIDLSLVRVDDGAVTASWQMMIQAAQKGISVLTVSATQDLDAPAPIALVWEAGGTSNIITAVGDMQIHHIEVDTKGMRKLKEGDVIKLTHIATVSAAFEMQGTITLFFKE